MYSRLSTKRHEENWNWVTYQSPKMSIHSFPLARPMPVSIWTNSCKFVQLWLGSLTIPMQDSVFYASHELSCKEFKDQFNVKETETAEHHDLSPSVIKQCEHSTVSNMRAAIMRHGILFPIEGHTLYNLITQAYIPEQYVSQILNNDDTGQKLYEEYVSEQISRRVSFWAPVKKEKTRCICLKAGAILSRLETRQWT